MKKFYTALLVLLVFMLHSIPAYADTTITRQAVERWISQEASINKNTVSRIVNAAYKQAGKHSIDPVLIISAIRTESRFNAHASSSYGAKGLMQVVPRWHRDKIAGRNILNIETNIEVGTQILADCLNKYNGRMNSALRCYSGGAKSYEAKLKAGHKSIMQADTIYRFENRLPLNKQAKFDKPFQYALHIHQSDKINDLVAMK